MLNDPEDLLALDLFFRAKIVIKIEIMTTKIVTLFNKNIP
jgi:hypothetical protein